MLFKWRQVKIMQSRSDLTVQLLGGVGNSRPKISLE
jgi:hypothetical protein